MPYTSPPVRWDHDLVIGDTYLPGVATLRDSTGAAYSIAGSTGTVQLRSEPGAAVTLTATYTIESAADGEFYWTADAATTATLAPGTYAYAVRITFADGSVRTVLEGIVTARRVAVG